MATRLEIQQTLQQPYDQKHFASKILKPVFGQAFAYAHVPSRPSILPNSTEQAVIKDVLIYGALALEDGTQVTCYEIQLQPGVRIEQSKVGIQQYVRKLITTGDAALINFISPKTKDTWRFTLVASDTKMKDDDIMEIKTNAKRYTYLVERERPNRTMAERLEALSLESDISLQSLIKAFSVEAMSKAFFNEYKEHYQDFVEYLTGKRMKKEKGKWEDKITGEPHPHLKSFFGGNEKDARDFIKKLMGRIVFLYFVQKKRWLGATTTEYKDGPFDFIAKLFDATEGNENFFPLGLSQLFFEALNKERPNDDWVMPVINKTVKIPYLNGGLFERDEIDELIHKRGDVLTFPPGLFSHVEKKDTPSERGFLDFLNAYNFTVYEDSEDDHTVAVDPEMLGHIFENLLEDNKDKGAFYTPKEIVHYMCQESLIEYLKTYLSGELDAALLEKLIRNKEAGAIDNTTLSKINDKLDTVKICDPAIGSGAFPMGLLLEIFTIKEVVSYKLQENFDAARVKEHIISNSIYGVDIERGAVDIARLRFWLSLVVDEDRPKALPNLDYKIMQGNSLLENYEGIDLSQVAARPNVAVIEPDKDLFGNYTNPQLKITLAKSGAYETIEKLIHEYFNVAHAHRKEHIRQEIDALVNEHIEFNLELRKLLLTRRIKESGNYDNLSTKAKKQVDTWKAGLDQLTDIGQKLKSERHKTDKNFFLWHLFFKEVFDQGGFDIVIGNPPYVQLQNEGGHLAKMYENQGFETFERTGDIYSLFYEKGFHILKKNGLLCYITSNKWMRAGYGESTRSFFANQTNPILLIDFAGQKIFESATVDVNILMFARDKNQHNTLACSMKENALNNLSVFVRQTGSISSFTDAGSWVILSDIEKQIKAKIERIGTPLKDWDIQINYGIKTGFNEAFIITGEQRKALIAQDPKSEEIIRPILRGRDIKRYGYDFADLWLINTHNGIKAKGIKPVNLNDYPAIKHWLDFGGTAYNGKVYQGYKQIEKRADQGDTPYNLRNCAYMEDFSKQKIVWIELTDHPNFCLDTEGYYLNNTVFFINGDRLPYILSFLNSKLCEWYFTKIAATSGAGTRRWIKIYIEQICIPMNIKKESEQLLESLAVEIQKLKKTKANTKKLEQEVESEIFKLIDLTVEEIDFIETQ